LDTQVLGGENQGVFTALVTFTLAATFIVLLPGPDTLVVLRNLVSGGRRTAALAVAGVLSGLTVWIVAAMAGLSALLRASSDGYVALRFAGAAYLLWLGVQSLRARTVARAEGAGALPGAGTWPAAAALPSAGAADRLDAARGRVSGVRRRLLGTGFGAGLATDLLNPKVGVFFVTFLPGFVPRGYPVGSTLAVFGGIFVAETAAYFALLLLLARRLTTWLHDPVIRRRLDRATALVLIGFGIRLAVER